MWTLLLLIVSVREMANSTPSAMAQGNGAQRLVNPIAISDLESDLSEPWTSSDCLSLGLELGTVDGDSGKSLGGKLRVTNTCGEPIALLAGPWERRVSLSGDEPISDGLSPIGVSATVFLWPSSARYNSRFLSVFEGEAVQGLPRVVVVYEGSTDLPVTWRGVDLPPGKYSAQLRTYVAPAGAFSAGVESGSLDLGYSVGDHNAVNREAPRVVLRPQATPVRTPVATLHVNVLSDPGTAK